MVAIKNFIKDETGASAIEYGLLAALIALVIAVGMTTVSTSLNGLFTKVGNCLSGKGC